jgi:hypothetical protein
LGEEEEEVEKARGGQAHESFGTFLLSSQIVKETHKMM